MFPNVISPLLNALTQRASSGQQPSGLYGAGQPIYGTTMESQAMGPGSLESWATGPSGRPFGMGRKKYPAAPDQGAGAGQEQGQSFADFQQQNRPPAPGLQRSPGYPGNVYQF